MLCFVKINSIHFLSKSIAFIFLTFYVFGSCFRMLVVPLLFHSFWASKFWDGWIFEQDHVLPSCLTHWVAQQNTTFCHMGLWFNNTGNFYSVVSHQEVWTHCFTRSFVTADIQNKTSTTTLVDWSRHVPKAAAHWWLPSRLYAPKLVYSFFW